MSVGTNDRCNNALLLQRQSLPIWKHKEALVNAIVQNQYCIVVSSTGSGKTTQLPQFLYEKGLTKHGLVGITQPRRVAAISVAMRVADELGSGAVGVGPVGYCVRFEDMTNKETTHLKYMTDGILLREAVLDPDLSRYDYIILDEAHECSLNTDVLFGVVLKAARRRAKVPHTNNESRVKLNKYCKRRTMTPLKVIVMSATIDPTPFLNFFTPELTQVIYIEGRTHKIKLLNTTEPVADYVADAASVCLRIHQSPTCPLNRSILVFLTGEEEIMRCCSLIKQLARAVQMNDANQKDVVAYPLFSSLPQAKQLQAISANDTNCRKVIVSTNLAETSITIPGIRYVVDCGRAKVRHWDAKTGLESFRIQWISKSQAWQRAGRAGREASGVCLRLYTDSEYKVMDLHPSPELSRAPLAGVLLNLISMNISNLKKFPWLTSPKPLAIDCGIELLKKLGAVVQKNIGTNSIQDNWCNDKNKQINASGDALISLTFLGRLMSTFPLEPRFSRTLISAAYFGCLIEMLTIISVLYVSPVFYVPLNKRNEFLEIQSHFYHPHGDLISLLLVYRAFIKSKKSAESQPKKCQLHWCRQHFINRTRMLTATRVRAQLKQLVVSVGLGYLMKSCGEQFDKLAKAFLSSGFRDQVVVLSQTQPNTSSKSSRHQAAYIRPSDHHLPSDNAPTFYIHPESQLYPYSFDSTTPHQCLLFIEASVVNKFQSAATDIDNKNRIFMRHLVAIDSGWLSATADIDNASQITEHLWLKDLAADDSGMNSSTAGSRKRKRLKKRSTCLSNN